MNTRNLESFLLLSDLVSKNSAFENLSNLVETKIKSCNLFLGSNPNSKGIHLNSGVKNLELKNFLLESCMEGEISCKQSKNILEKDYQEFEKCFERANQTSQIKDVASCSFSNAVDSTRKEVFPHSSSNERKRITYITKDTQGTNSQKKYVSPCSFTNALEAARKEVYSNPSSNERKGITFIGKDAQHTNLEGYLKNIDPKMIEVIESEIMDTGITTNWDDIAGLNFVKSAIQEAVIWPMLRPDIFTGLRRPPKGILLFGPPGTGKTLLGKCVATNSKSTFFSISAASLTSKWIGDGEKMVRALFAVARCHQPAVIFIDEIDSLLSQRSDTEHESSRRLKTEFFIQIDGASTAQEERLLLIAATNRPQELDEAARRRFVKRLYIPLPEFEARLELLKKLTAGEKHSLTEENYERIANLSQGYSGADIRSLCSEASMGPVRSIQIHSIEDINSTDVRPLMLEDFEKAFLRVKSSVSSEELNQYVIWNEKFGFGC
ncbi:hypothetical protein WA026_010090 [Henosepilachna vigintioctopunctata]|uniref:AAA+ ATPase domain-containing protein n=1 Tax=Henosepilachna vigintioctopunctata TaxID=420089 RepID=A0AAW1UKE2_9CUCU